MFVLFVDNGTIDFDEFCGVMRRHQQSTSAAVDAHHAFKARTHSHFSVVTFKAYAQAFPRYSGILCRCRC